MYDSTWRAGYARLAPLGLMIEASAAQSPLSLAPQLCAIPGCSATDGGLRDLAVSRAFPVSIGAGVILFFRAFCGSEFNAVSARPRLASAVPLIRFDICANTARYNVDITPAHPRVPRNTRVTPAGPHPLRKATGAVLTGRDLVVCPPSVVLQALRVAV